MPEQAINIGEKEERISCILHTPSIEQREKIVILFVHGWAGYRIGPHQMFVKYARQLSEMGYYCMRFDFRGRGYSAGNRAETSSKTMLFDLDQLIAYLKSNIRYDKIILLGICSGAKMVLYYAKSGSQKINGVIEMSSSLLRYDLETHIKINRKKNSISNYINREKINKLLSGEVSLKKLVEVPFRYASFQIRNGFSGLKVKKSKTPIQTKAVREDNSFKNYAGTSFLLIHGEKDPETEISMNQITSLVTKYGYVYDKHIIVGANHSFYSIHWEKEIFDILKRWIIKHHS